MLGLDSRDDLLTLSLHLLLQLVAFPLQLVDLHHGLVVLLPSVRLNNGTTEDWRHISSELLAAKEI